MFYFILCCLLPKISYSPVSGFERMKLLHYAQIKFICKVAILADS